MILETAGRLLYKLVPHSFSLSVSLWVVVPVFVLTLLFYYLWPLVDTFGKRIRQVDDLPGPKCSSVILGNVPFEVLRSLISSSNEKNLIISK